VGGAWRVVAAARARRAARPRRRDADHARAGASADPPSGHQAPGLLGRVGLVAGRRQGREVRYAVDSDRLAEAERAMSAVAAQWDRRLARIKAIAEAVHARRQLPAGDQ